jgi:hypothetical protein
MHDKRRYVRVGTRIPVVYSLREQDGGGPVARRGVIDSMSPGGALIASEDQLERGVALALRIPITSMADSVAAQATVLRSDPGEQAGQFLTAVEFRDVPFEDARRIAGLVDRELTQLLATFQDLADQLELVRDFSHTIAGAHDARTVLDTLVDSAMRATGATAGSVLIMDGTGEWLNFAVVRGPKAREIEKFRVRIGDGIAGLIAHYGRPLNVPDPQRDQRWRGDIAEAIDFDTRSILGVPFSLAGQVAGVVQVLNKQDSGRFSSEDLRILDALSAQAGVALQNLRLAARLRGEEPDFPHLPLGVQVAPGLCGSPGADAFALAAQGATAVYLTQQGCLVFSYAARDLMDVMDAHGDVAWRVEEAVVSLAVAGGHLAAEGAVHEFPVAGIGTLKLRVFSLVDADGRPCGVVAHMEAEDLVPA